MVITTTATATATPNRVRAANRSTALTSNPAMLTEPCSDPGAGPTTSRRTWTPGPSPSVTCTKTGDSRSVPLRLKTDRPWISSLTKLACFPSIVRYTWPAFGARRTQRLSPPPRNVTVRLSPGVEEAFTTPPIAPGNSEGDQLPENVTAGSVMAKVPGDAVPRPTVAF